MNKINRSKFVRHRAYLLDCLAEGAPRHRAVDLIERNGGARRMIIANALAGVRIDQPFA